jgi:predicted nuclease of predicted toxin-antitoxin system
VKLLFDANLSPRLTALLRDVFPDSAHVSDFGHLAADDLSIWSHARDNGFTIVSKDSDFHRMSFVMGAPPRVIWLRIGNCATVVVERVLRFRLPQIELFDKSEDATFLVVDPPPP